MKKFLVGLILALSFGYSQTPIIRLLQSKTYDTPMFWWRDTVTHNLRTYLADDASAPAYKNNNFDAWRDSVMTMAVTLDDNGASVTAFRLDIVFDNDIFTWGHDSTRVEKGAYINGWTEGDSSAGAHYSYEVVHYANVGYTDSLDAANNEISATNNRYDWLRITMVSHNGNVKTFGNGNGNQTELLKLHFKVDDVVDNFAPKSFRVATKYEGSAGYYTYLTNGNYAVNYKVYVDGNVGTETDGIGNTRGDITLHPKLLDVEGYFRYVQGKGREAGAAFSTATENTYPYWKVKFELHERANGKSNWLNLQNTGNESSVTDESTTDDVIGDNSTTFTYDLKGTTGQANVTGNGFLGISYYDSTYTDDKGYFNIQLPRNNDYRVSFWPPDDDDDIETHTPKKFDRYAITNINDAIASFNFQSNKFKSITGVDTLNAIEYFIGDVDGDDKFFLNDTYILWSYVSGIMGKYAHHSYDATADSLQDWSTVDNMTPSRNYYQTLMQGDTRKQRYEFTVFWDKDFNQAANLSFGQVEVTNTLMNDIVTGQDTLYISLVGNNPDGDSDSSRYLYDDPVDFTLDSIAYFFTGDINTTGTKVKANGSLSDPKSASNTAMYDTLSGNTFYRWAGGSAPSEHANKFYDPTAVGRLNKISTEGYDVKLSLPADSTVKVQSGNQIEVPLTITPNNGINIAGFEFEIEFKPEELNFIDMQTDILPGPWMTYVNVGDIVDGWQRVSFGGMDYSPGNAPERYWINRQMIGLKLLFSAEFPPGEWTDAPIRFVGKYAAGNPSGKDLTVKRDDGMVRVWNKYWLFGGSEPDNEEITYNFPNPFTENTKFQFYLSEPQNVKLYIVNSMGQKVGTLLDAHVLSGIHYFDFTNEPNVWIPEQSVYEAHKKLEPGVYVFVLQTDKRIKTSKFTVIK
tara:strand:+ start:1026 stop:3761 length:2736 start_codon:yes stop_codon:yes gene_type:complete